MDKGVITYTCKNDNSHNTEQIGALGHNLMETITKEAAATETGETAYICTVCGEVKTEEIAALGASGSGSGNGCGGSSNSNSADQKTSPKTGDEANIALWVVLILSCAGALAVTRTARKKHED